MQIVKHHLSTSQMVAGFAHNAKITISMEELSATGAKSWSLNLTLMENLSTY